ncbi:hypothetical protein LXL04_004635 [Taraxacum kok-saghyz]
MRRQNMAQNSDPKSPAIGSDADSSPAMPHSTWAKRTGFRPNFSGETNASHFGQSPSPRPNNSSPPAPLDLETGGIRTIASAPTPQPANAQMQPQSSNDQPETKMRCTGWFSTGTAQAWSRRSHMKYELRDTPGLVPSGFYGFQHYLSMLGSLVLVPLVIVPAMGGDHEDISMVVSTVLFVSGITTLLQANFGSRLPLIQGPSLVFLAPALAIIKSPEFLELNENSFKHIMKELQGAIIIASGFQALLGYTGLITLLLS